MNKKVTIFALVIIIIVALVAVVAGYFKSQMKILPINSIVLDTVNDGKYIGSAKNVLITVEVEVNVIKHEIKEIKIIKHDNGLGSKAEKIVEKVISEQTLEVDNISGATYSSNMILKAIESALEKGVKH